MSCGTPRRIQAAIMSSLFTESNDCLRQLRVLTFREVVAFLLRDQFVADLREERQSIYNAEFDTVFKNLADHIEVVLLGLRCALFLP